MKEKSYAWITVNLEAREEVVRFNEEISKVVVDFGPVSLHLTPTDAKQLAEALRQQCEALDLREREPA